MRVENSSKKGHFWTGAGTLCQDGLTTPERKKGIDLRTTPHSVPRRHPMSHHFKARRFYRLKRHKIQSIRAKSRHRDSTGPHKKVIPIESTIYKLTDMMHILNDANNTLIIAGERSTGMGQYFEDKQDLMKRKSILLCHVHRHACHDPTCTRRSSAMRHSQRVPATEDEICRHIPVASHDRFTLTGWPNYNA